MLASVTRVVCCIAIGCGGICHTCSVLCSCRICWRLLTRVLCCITIGYVGICYTCSVLHNYGICWHLLHMLQVV